MPDPSPYGGVDNLEVMQVAVRYRRYLADLMRSAGGPPDAAPRVLDFGAGVGTYAHAGRDLGYDVTCVEIDDELRRTLTGSGFVTHAATDEIDDGVFDLTYSFNVLEHIDDDGAALRELRRVTRADGRLLLYVPAFPVLYSTMDRKVGHLRRYRSRELCRKVRQAGFAVESCVHADSLGFLASLGYRAVGRRDGTLSERSVALYDRWLFPLSRRLDGATGRLFGKNLALTARPSAGL